jgi:hypothetical protein
LNFYALLPFLKAAALIFLEVGLRACMLKKKDSQREKERK